MGMFVLALSGVAQVRPFYDETVLCCNGVFTEAKALATAKRMARDHPARVKLIILTDDAGQFTRIGGSEDTYRRLRERLLGWRGQPTKTALYFETTRGASFDLWNGSTKAFSRSILWGENPFVLSEAVEIVASIQRGLVVEFYCASLHVDDVSQDRLIEERLRSILPDVEMRVFIGGSPFQYATMWTLPFLPVYGWGWPTENEIGSRSIAIKNTATR